MNNDDINELGREVFEKHCGRPHPWEGVQPWVIALVRAAIAAEAGMPPLYMLTKLQMVMPVMQEARDALTAISEAQRKLHGISPDLADRMDRAGTFSLADWQAAQTVSPSLT